MNLQYYFNLVTIVEEGSLTAAAKKLRIAQPALSNQVKAMEQKYGTRLFFRGSRRLELTDAGSILYQRPSASVRSNWPPRMRSPAASPVSGAPCGLV